MSKSESFSILSSAAISSQAGKSSLLRGSHNFSGSDMDHRYLMHSDISARQRIYERDSSLFRNHYTRYKKTPRKYFLGVFFELHILHLHPLCEYSYICNRELGILLYATDSDPHRDESHLERREIVLEIEEIILGPVGRDIYVVVRVLLYDMLH